jgi:xylulokinase
VSLGTSATLFGVAGQPVIDPTCAVCPFCDATGAWLPLICTLNCTVPAEEVAAAFGMSHEDITALAGKEAAGAEGVNFLPYLLGERTPNWPSSSGAVLGLKPGRRLTPLRVAAAGSVWCCPSGHLDRLVASAHCKCWRHV